MPASVEDNVDAQVNRSMRRGKVISRMPSESGDISDERRKVS